MDVRSGPTYFINGINDGGGIFPLEFQGNLSILLAINERRYPLLIGGSILRGKVPPLFENIIFCCEDELLITDSWGEITEITRSENLSGPSIAASDKANEGGHQR